MCPAQRRKNHQARAYLAFALAAMSGLFGLGFTLIKSPQAQSGRYLALAMESYEQGAYAESAVAARQAVRLDPVTPANWLFLSRALQAGGQESAAQRAQVIAIRLQHNGDPRNPFYAAPADLKLSFLAMTPDGGR